MASRGVRDRVVVATKASRSGKEHPLAADEIRAAAERSLREPADRRDRPLLRALGRPDDAAGGDAAGVRRAGQAGKVRYVAASNYSAKRLTEALETSDRLGVARYAALQTHYNLMERAEFEGELQDLLAAGAGWASLPYYSLAKGFLTGKYRAGERVDSPRAEGAAAYVGERGDRVLAALEEVAGRRTCRCRRWRCAGWPTSRRWSRRSPAGGGGAAGGPAADAGPGARRRRAPGS